MFTSNLFLTNKIMEVIMKMLFILFLIFTSNILLLAQEEEIKRPEPMTILNLISTELRLSSKQEDRIKKSLEKEVKDFDKIMSEYEKKYKELKKLEYETNELKYKMIKINKNIPDVIREFLDDEQKIKFDKIINPPPKKESKEVKEEKKEPDEKISEQTKPTKKKKILVKRKKKPLNLNEAPQTIQTKKETENPKTSTPQPEPEPKESTSEDEGDVYYP